MNVEWKDLQFTEPNTAAVTVGDEYGHGGYDK